MKFRAIAARVRGKAETCAYITKCTCFREVAFTDSIIRDVLIACIADLDIRREVLGTSAILERAVNDVISLIVESKDMAKNALSSSRLEYPPSNGADRYQQRNRLPLIDPRLRCAQIANICTLLGRSSRLEHPTTPSMYKVLHRTHEAAHRLVSMLTAETGALFAQLSSLNASCGDNRQSPASPTPQTSSPWSRASWERATPR